MQLTTTNKLICTADEYYWSKTERTGLLKALTAHSLFLEDLGLTEQVNALVDAVNDVLIVEEEPNYAQ